MPTVGIDVGFESTKVVILKGGMLLAHAIVPNGRQDLDRVINKALEEVIAKAETPADCVDCIIATGDGGAQVTVAHGQASEAQCCACGSAMLMPPAHTILDMGAETCMAVRTCRGMPLNIVRNDRCASGTGRSLKMAAKMLGKSLEDMGVLSLLSREEISINNTCAVFAESEIISKIHHQYRVEDIAKAVFRGLARRAHSLIVKVGLEKDVAMVGGLANNAGMIRALQDELGCQVLVPDQPMIVGALGAALIAEGKTRS
ncbi:MAG: hypothetical protein KJ720_12440 [Proteobacteria bacterium]|nr:hypothetical protein [Pseudomonadota bacterium]MBU2468499.1 hypothetical protein [Pseudomonadota bacterium]